MYFYSRFIHYEIIFSVLLFDLLIVLGNDGSKSIRILSDDVITELYTMYREAVENDSTTTTRRLFKNNEEFSLHVKKLKEVNGYKQHNLVIKRTDLTRPIIYINNPVESSLPNAYLSPKEFKKFLTDRVKGQRTEFQKSKVHTFIVHKKTTVINTHGVEKTANWKLLVDTTFKDKIICNISEVTEESISKSKGIEEFQIKTTSKIAYMSNSMKNTPSEVNNQDVSTSIIDNITKILEPSLDSTNEYNLTSESTDKPIANITEAVIEKDEIEELSSVTEDVKTIIEDTTNIIQDTTPPTDTTRTRRSTLGRPRVFMG